MKFDIQIFELNGEQNISENGWVIEIMVEIVQLKKSIYLKIKTLYELPYVFL